MTALDFPDAPAKGQVFDRWVYDGSKWMLSGAGVVDTGPPKGSVWVAGIDDAGPLVQGGAGSTIAAPRYLNTGAGYRTPGAPMKKNANNGVVLEVDGVYRLSFSIKFGVTQYAFFGLEHVRNAAPISTYLAEVNVTAALLAGQPGASGKLNGYAQRERTISAKAGDILRPMGYAPSFGYDANLVTVGGGDSIMEVIYLGPIIEAST